MVTIFDGFNTTICKISVHDINATTYSLATEVDLS